jgi:gluconokinase
MDYYTGVDIGTSSVKALALGPGGETLGIRKQAYPAHTDAGGRHEEDPDVIAAATFSVLRSLIDALPDHRPVCVSFSAAMHGLLALDSGGRPLTPLITWADTRATAEAAAFKETPAAREVYRLTGTPIHPMSPLCKLRWLKDAQPGVFAKASVFVSIKEYVWFRLFGVYEIDRSIASATGLFDTQAGHWCAPALEAAGITENRLSQPVAVTHSRRGAREGFPTDLPFVIGAGDGCLANLGTGVVSPGEASVTVGTSGAVRVITDRWQPEREERLFQYSLTDGAYVRGGATNNGGNLLDWFMGVAGGGSQRGAGDLPALLDEAFALPEGSDGLLFLPYLYGERAPVWDAEARGAYVGLRAYHQKTHLLRAITEGIGYALFDIFRILDAEAPIHTVYASGGFTQNVAWVQQLADTFGKPVCLTDEGDASATGAALLGMLALGALTSLSDAKHRIRPGKVFAPDPARHTLYQRYYASYTRLYPALHNIFIP